MRRHANGEEIVLIDLKYLRCQIEFATFIWVNWSIFNIVMDCIRLSHCHRNEIIIALDNQLLFWTRFFRSFFHAIIFALFFSLSLYPSKGSQWKKNLVLLISTKCHNNTFVRAASFFKCMQFARELKSYIYTLRASIHKIIFSSMKSSYLRAVVLWIIIVVLWLFLYFFAL